MNNKRKILVVSFQSLTKKSAGGMARLGYYVSAQLHKRGLLKKFVVFSKGKFETDFPSVPVSRLAKYYLFLLNYANKFMKLPEHKFRLIQEHLYDILCQGQITRDIDILFTTNAHLRRTFRKAKKFGINIIYVPANPEENYINELVSTENKKLGIDKYDPYTYPSRVNFFNESIKYVDTVIGTYPTVYDTYASAAAKYNLVNITGHLKPDFPEYHYEPRQINESFHVIYIASTIPLKGLQYLLEAWQQIMKKPEGQNMHLHVVGFIDVSVKKYIATHFDTVKHVTYAGRVPDVPTYLRDKDLCVVPSLTDGGPYVALEAAHYGLPVVMTENCGSTELLSRDPSGCIIIPIRDPKSIAEAILWAYNNRREAIQMGINAKNNLDNYDMHEFVLEVTDYLERHLATTK